MTESTREQLVTVAQRLFAQRGFYGTSLAGIAGELEITKQALLHHFGSKEKLYGEVLNRVSDDMLHLAHEITETHSSPEHRLVELIAAQYREQMDDPITARLVMRELLDNEPRAASAETWYLKPYLDLLMDTFMEIKSERPIKRPQALAFIYQLLGAAHYFAVSQPTLTRMFGDEQLGRVRDLYENELRRLVQSRLAEHTVV